MKPTIKAVIKSRVNKDGKTPILLRVTLHRRTKFFPLGIDIEPENFIDGKAKKGRIGSFQINTSILEITTEFQ